MMKVATNKTTQLTMATTTMMTEAADDNDDESFYLSSATIRSENIQVKLQNISNLAWSKEVCVCVWLTFDSY